MATGFITHPDCLLHDTGANHPECADRLRAIDDQLIACGLANCLERFEAPLATRDQLARVHALEYIEAIESAAPEQGVVHLDPDTAMNPHTLQAALRAAGAVVMAADLVIGKKLDNAFCSVRPPGHHAEKAHAMGFCLFNNVAVGAAHALEAHGLSRVAVVDFDVHHGNGTEDIFTGDARVLMVSTFQHPFYPFSGAEANGDNMVNVPLAAGAAGDAFRAAVLEKWIPALERFKPEMIFFSAGFDAHRDDEMALLNLVDADYAWVTRTIKAVAERHSQGRMVSVLEGGYELHALGRSVAAHLKVMSGL